MKMSTIGWIGLAIGLIGGLAGLAVGIMAAPVEGSIVGAVIVSIFFLIYWFFFKPIITSNRILKTGEHRNGKILEVWDTNVTINNNPQIGLLVEVKDKYGKTYQTKTKMVISRLQVGDVRPGQAVTVRVDPQNEQKIAIESFGAGGDVSYTKNEYEEDLQQILGQIDKENKEILLSGISAEAKVVGYYDLNIKVNGDNPMVMLFLEIYPGLQTPFFAEAKGVIATQSVPKFQPGNMITVKYDPRNTSRVTVEHS
jgi:hypothetical protein